ncbi:MAG TPA: 2-amino-4-hydroxy-6-hydroxymethyldihydropteridine diphosphokinase [Hanamia sp.]|nr:2-amino-4-hydroxy-6-hydroxymethyldihydropteridine diphosphokinase [Hanamia sp.]
MNTAFLITGGNIGNRNQNLQTAASLIEEQIGPIIKSSKIYETDAWGITDQPTFYNQVLIIESKYSAREVMRKILKIEEKMGRIRSIKNAARIIDIDILFFNDEIINEPNLIIPHTEIGNRRFVLIPLNELAPEMVHPLFKKSIHELLSTTKDELNAIPLPSLP